ncbi:hypothetical protein PAALTS15_21133 [Paenibacillus alvei TS-15]|uniref:Uncharacterized protein n=2 Tax=Paenibacillus TaxID=44249 RepID=S9SMC3_PAEAL|nr:hypothetical protein PAALTS15_21133 [Paenibacillus alvei TS-15]
MEGSLIDDRESEYYIEPCSYERHIMAFVTNLAYPFRGTVISAAWFIHSLRGQARRVLTSIVAACAVITLLSNIMGLVKALDTVKQTYDAQIQSAFMHDQTTSPRHNIIAKD